MECAQTVITIELNTYPKPEKKSLKESGESLFIFYQKLELQLTLVVQFLLLKIQMEIYVQKKRKKKRRKKEQYITQRNLLHTANQIKSKVCLTNTDLK